MTKIKVLHDTDGTIVVPVTTSVAVRDEQGRSLYDAMASKLTTVTTDDIADRAVTHDKIDSVGANALESWTLLFDGDSTGTTLTLSDTIANYDVIKIVGRVAGDRYSYDVRNYRSASIEYRLGHLGAGTGDGNNIPFWRSQIITLSGTTITRGYGAYMSFNQGLYFAQQTNGFHIDKVYGVKTI